MLNIEQFATICAHSLAIHMAKPGNAGPNFTWDESFPRMAVTHIQTQWFLANRSERTINQRLVMVERIAKKVARDFAEITGKP